MANKWPEETTVQFMEFYKEHECLLNTKLLLYRNKQARDDAINKILLDMNIVELNATDIKNKIKNLRSTYIQEVAKITKSYKSGMEAEDAYVPRVKWFTIMHSFMKDMGKNRETTSNLVQDSQLETPGFESQQEDATQSLDETLVEEESMVSTQTANNVVSTPTPNNEVSAPTPKRPKVTRKRVKEVASCIEGLNSLAESFKELEPKKEDEFDIFGLRVAAQLKKLPVQQAISCQGSIQNLLTTYRMANIDEHLSTRQAPSLTPSVSSGQQSSNTEFEDLLNVDDDDLDLAYLNDPNIIIVQEA